MAKKSLGQHWLDDTESLDSIVALSSVSKGDEVLEIGPGHGSLTRKLLKAGASVTAIELDEELADKLKINVISPSFNVISQDILSFDLNKMPQGYKVVANIPYYLTSKLIRTLSESKNPPKEITLLVQKEVAQRIAATPGQMSLLSVSAQLYYEVSLGTVVPAKLFNPPPKVDSQVVHMVRKPAKTYQQVDTKLLFRIVKGGFSSRRKTLENSLSAGLHLSKPEIVKILHSCQIDPRTRPQELSLQQWIALSNSVLKYN